MRIEALRFKKEDKTEVIIIIEFRDSYTRDSGWMLGDILYRPYRKRSFQSLYKKLSDDFQYRHMNYDEKDAAKRKAMIDYVGLDKVKEAYIVAWEKIKPDFEKLCAGYEEGRNE